MMPSCDGDVAGSYASVPYVNVGTNTFPPGETASTSASTTAAGPPSTPPRLLYDEWTIMRSPPRTPSERTAARMSFRVTGTSCPDRRQQLEQAEDQHAQQHGQQEP